MLAAVVLLAGVLGAASPAVAQMRPGATGAPAVVVYRAPVDGPVIDPFRAPAHIGAPGNRGLEYATRPAGPVRAAAAGTVLFAGQVAGRRHVTLLHADGVRTSYSFLRTIRVRRGDHLRAGQVLGTTGATFHFGARIGNAYVDPAVLLDATAPPRLIPVAAWSVRTRR